MDSVCVCVCVCVCVYIHIEKEWAQKRGKKPQKKLQIREIDEKHTMPKLSARHPINTNRKYTHSQCVCVCICCVFVVVAINTYRKCSVHARCAFVFVCFCLLFVVVLRSFLLLSL